MAVPVVLDVDTGVDDALAIALAVAHPGVDLLAVTCVSGNVDVDQVVDNTTRLLDHLGAHHVPVLRGCDRPLRRGAQDSGGWHGRDGMADLGLPRANPEATGRRGSGRGRGWLEELSAVLVTSEVPVTLVGLGPATNLATLLEARPEVVGRLAGLRLMGGALGRGNVSEHAEFNAWCDPEALRAVLLSGAPVTLYPLEPFDQVRTEPALVRELYASGNERLRTVARLLEHRPPEGGEPVLGDAGVLLSLLVPSATVVRRHVVDVDVDDEHRGRTRMGSPLVGAADGPGVVDVVHAADRAAFVDLYRDSIHRLTEGRS